MATQTISTNVNVDEIGYSFIGTISASASCYQSEYGYNTYNARTMSATLSWTGVACGDGHAVFIASGSQVNNVMHDGKVNPVANGNLMPTASSWTDIAYGGGTYVAVATVSAIASTMSLTRGELWTNQALPVSTTWASIAAGVPSGTGVWTFVAVTSSTANFAYSTNRGVSWTGGTLPSSGSWKVRFGNGRFLAIRNGNATALYSTDGINWNTSTLPSAASWTDLAYNNSIWVAVANTNASAYSTDNGASWTASTMPASGSWKIAAGKTIEGYQMFVAIASSTTSGAYSTNGYTWYTFAAPNGAILRLVWLPLSWSSLDALIINNNATVTVNTNQVKSWSAITINSGTLNIVNSSTSTANRFLMGGNYSTSQRSITTFGLGTVNMAGARIQIGTGTGVAGQTFTVPYTDYVASIWVETGNGTNTYEQWLNVTKAYGLHPPIWRRDGLYNVASGKHGNYFVQGANAVSTYGGFTISGGVTYGTKFVYVTSTAGVLPGASISGTGIVWNSVVEQVVSSTVLRLHTPTTVSAGPNTYTVFNPMAAQMNSTLTVGDGTHGNVVPSGARVWIPNIMMTDVLPCMATYSSTISYYGGITLTNAGKFYADTCLFDLIYGNFNQATLVSLNYVGVVYMFQIAKVTSLSITNFGISNSPARHWYPANSIGWNFVYFSSQSYEYIYLTYCPNARLDNIHIVNYGGSGLIGSANASDTVAGMVTFANGCDGAICTNLRQTTLAARGGGPAVAAHFSSNILFNNIESYGNGGQLGAISYGSNITVSNVKFKPGYLNEYMGANYSNSYLNRILRDASNNILTTGKYYIKVRNFYDYGSFYWVSGHYLDMPVVLFQVWSDAQRGRMVYGGAYPNGVVNTVVISFLNLAPIASQTPAIEIYRSTTTGFSTRDVTTLLTRQNYNVNAYADNGAGSLTAPINGTTYYYVVRKYFGGFSLASCTVSSGTPNLTTTSNLNAFSTVGNVRGDVGTNVLYFAGLYDYSGGFGALTPGMPVTATGIPGGTTITSISDDGMTCVISNYLTANLLGVNVSYGFTAGMVVYHANLPPDTRILTINSNTSATLTKNATSLISAATVVLLSGFYETPEFEATPYTLNASTNLLLQSYTLDNASWTKTNAYVTPNMRYTTSNDSLIAISGSTSYATADRIYIPAASGTLSQTVATSIGLSYTFTIWIVQEVSVFQPDNNVTGQIQLGTATQTFTGSSNAQKISVAFTATATTTTATIQVNSNSAIYTVTNTTVTTNYITVNSTTGLIPGQMVTFSGTTFGNIIGAGTVYYVKQIISLTQFTISASYVVDMTAAAVFALTTASGTMTCVIVYYLCVGNAQVELTSTAYGLPIATTTTTYTFTPINVTSAVSFVKDQYTGTQIGFNNPSTTNITRYWELFLGTTSGFTPSESNMIMTNYGTNANALYAYSGTNMVYDTVTQDQPWGMGGYGLSVLYAASSAQVLFRNITIPINGRKFSILDCSSAAPIVTMANCQFDYYQNYISSLYPIVTANSTKSLTIKNTRSNLYDIPHSITTLQTAIRGLFGGKSTSTNNTYDPRWTLGSSQDGDQASYTAMYDDNFHELYTGTTTGIMRLNFTESLLASKPYTVVSGNPRFDDTGKLYFYNPGDSIEFIWDHKILGVSGFQNAMPRMNGVDLGPDRTTNFCLVTEYAVDTGSGYGSYKTLTKANLITETVSASTGFKFKIRFTAYAGMKITTQTSLFVLNETINGLTSGATARVIAIENNNLSSNSSSINVDTISGVFAPGETIRSSVTTRGTNSATNGFALYPSFTSYINALEIYTNVDQTVMYPVFSATFTITQLVYGSYIGILNDGSALVSYGTSTLTYAYTYDYYATYTYSYVVRKPGYGEVRSTWLTLSTDQSTLAIQTLFRNVLDASGYTGIAINGVAKTITVTSSHSLLELYDYAQWWSCQMTNMTYDVPMTISVDQKNIYLTTGWTLIVSGAGVIVSDTTRSLAGTISTVSGGLYLDITGAVWTASGNTYYASLFTHIINDGTNPLVGVAVAYFDSAKVNRTYNTSLASVSALITNSSGQVTGYAVYKINSTTYTGHFVRARTYGFLTGTGSRTVNGAQINDSITVSVDSFVSDSSSTVSTFTGIAMDYSLKTITVTSSHTLFHLYEFIRYSDALTANFSQPDTVSTINGIDYLLTANWSLQVSGTSVALSDTTKSVVFQGTGVLTISSGGLYDDKNGAVWNVSGTYYYGKHIYRNVKAITGGANIQYAIVACFDSGGVDRTYSTSLINSALSTDGSGNAEGFFVYKVGSSTLIVNEYIGKYGYQWSTIPVSPTGAPTGTAVAYEVIRMVTDQYAVLSQSAALALPGIVTDHTAKTLDMGSRTYSEVQDNLRARQASTANIETGLKGYVSYYLAGTILGYDGTFYQAKSDWEYWGGVGGGIFKGGEYRLSTPGVINMVFDSVTLDFATAGTYDLRGSTITGTLTLVNTSGGSVTVKLVPGRSYTNLGPNITVTSSLSVSVVVNNIIAGSRIQIYDTSNSVELWNEIVTGTSFTGPYAYTTNVNIRIRIMYVNGASVAYKWYKATGTITAVGFMMNAGQEANTVYTDNYVDGSLVTECSIGVDGISVYVDDPDNITSAQRIYNWYQYYLFTATGIATGDNLIVAIDSTHFIFDNSVKIKNLDTVNPLNITGANITPVTGVATNVFDLSNGASIAVNYERVEGFNYAGGSGLSVDEHNWLSAVNTNVINMPTDVWDVAKADLLTTGSIGEHTRKRILTVNNYLGLK